MFICSIGAVAYPGKGRQGERDRNSHCVRYIHVLLCFIRRWCLLFLQNIQRSLNSALFMVLVMFLLHQNGASSLDWKLKLIQVLWFYRSDYW
ncbi:hypothetical protein TNCV_16781 [Trichonephila clavipes]|nr:hypothetical protein TNCV_16781 [Trichonephila clavipes]